VSSWLLQFSPSAAEDTAVGAECMAVVVADSAAVVGDSEVAGADSVAAAHLAAASETVDSETVDSAAALTAALDSVDDSGSFRSTDFTEATDTIPSSTTRPRTIPILILILMPVGTHLPGTVLAHLA
jgi:hypothetical protein